jgi:hypothetical protein
VAGYSAFIAAKKNSARSSKTFFFQNCFFTLSKWSEFEIAKNEIA